MNCPKCNSEFETVSFKEIEVERCTHCKGLWFDMLEKEDLMKIKGSESIDIGSDQVGEQYRDLHKINCPHCNRQMLPMVDKDKFHIKYESCVSCYGAFFDAGEFRDLKEHNILERFSQMLRTLRRNL